MGEGIHALRYVGYLGRCWDRVTKERSRVVRCTMLTALVGNVAVYLYLVRFFIRFQ